MWYKQPAQLQRFRLDAIGTPPGGKAAALGCAAVALCSRCPHLPPLSLPAFEQHEAIAHGPGEYDVGDVRGSKWRKTLWTLRLFCEKLPRILLRNEWHLSTKQGASLGPRDMGSEGTLMPFNMDDRRVKWGLANF